MKPLPLFRLVITLSVVAISVYYLENRRMANSSFYKNHKGSDLEAKSMKISNTDFIFFESLSKYLFISFAQ